jgi:uncharacterized protein (DUF433 family)
MTRPDPLTVQCPYCRAPAGEPCGVRGWKKWRARPAVRPHKGRVKLALVLAAHADPALDAFFPPLGPCGICGTPGLNQRHRVVDAIAGRLEAGEDPDEVAEDYGISEEAVDAVAGWAARWPEAWQ